jgi:glucose-1-phosphate thymidylyltransferase
MIITSREHCGQLVELLGDGTEYKCKLTYRIQEMNRPVVGIAQALGLAQDFVENTDAFAVILGDNFYEESFTEAFTTFDNTSTNLPSGGGRKYSSFMRDWPFDHAHVFLKEVHDPERFGVATIDANGKVLKIVEKPKEPESKFAVTGLYLYTPHVFKLLPTLLPSKRNELEITDINNWYVNSNSMGSTMLQSYWHDMGTPEAVRETENYIWEQYAKV